MIEAAKYSAIEVARDGSLVEIRSLRTEDRSALISAIDRSSSESFYRRFFGARHHFSESEIAYFMNVDFINHVALVAVVEEKGYPTIVGGGRYFVMQPGKAEVAFAVVDQYQSQGVGTALMRHLVAIARDAGLIELVADVLPGNIPMLKVFEKSGVHVSTKREPDVIHVVMEVS
jgi:RimJ/RimL family protein N-acetyltransferase